MCSPVPPRRDSPLKGSALNQDSSASRSRSTLVGGVPQVVSRLHVSHDSAERPCAAAREWAAQRSPARARSAGDSSWNKRDPNSGPRGPAARAAPGIKRLVHATSVLRLAAVVTSKSRERSLEKFNTETSARGH